MSKHAEVFDMMSGFQHQCRLPPIWFARLIGSRVGRLWICPKCAHVWKLVYVNFMGAYGAPPDLMEWRQNDLCIL